MVAVLSIVGRKGSGKAEVIEGLLAQFAARGMRVGVVKHIARQDAEVDEPGRDSFRYRAQGASKVVLAGRVRLALFENLEREQPLPELLTLFRGFDLVILEGYCLEEVPKVEVFREELGDLLLTERMGNVLAICSETRSARDVPHFSKAELGQLADHVEMALLDQEARSR